MQKKVKGLRGAQKPFTKEEARVVVELREQGVPWKYASLHCKPLTEFTELWGKGFLTERSRP
jgi:hypothetical protein